MERKAGQFGLIIKLETDMTVSYQVQIQQETRPQTKIFGILSATRTLTAWILGCFTHPQFDFNGLNPRLLRDSGIDEQFVLRETTKSATLIR